MIRLVLAVSILWSSVAFAAPKLAPIVELACGGEQCARRADGSLWCWGQRRNFADGVVAASSPVAVKVADGVKKFAVGGYRGVAIRNDGVPVLWRWKVARDGTPKEVTLEPHKTITDAVDVALVASEQVVLLRADGTAVTWVPNSQADGPSYASKPVVGLEKARTVSCGGVSCCSLVSNGTVTCFDPSEAIARPAPDVNGAREVSVGETQAIVRTAKGDKLLDLYAGRAPKPQRARLKLSRFVRGGCGLDGKGQVSCPWMLGEEQETMPALGRGLKVVGVGGGTACAMDGRGRVQCRRFADAARGKIDPVIQVKFDETPLAK